jgi:hypothetical protein
LGNCELQPRRMRTSILTNGRQTADWSLERCAATTLFWMPIRGDNMKAIYCGATLIFIAMVGWRLLHYGKTWEFSPRCVPVSALSPDGKTYKNGETIDPMNAGIIRSGSEESVMGAMMLTLLAAFGSVFYQLWGLARIIEARERRKRQQSTVGLSDDRMRRRDA